MQSQEIDVNKAMLTRLQRIIEKHDGPIIIHIGPGLFYPGTKGGRAILPNELHICFETDSKRHQQFRNERKKRQLKSVISFPRLVQLNNDIVNCANEVHIHNVFNQNSENRNLAAVLIRHAKAMLKPGGNLYVGHTMPGMTMTADELEELAKREGLTFEIIAQPRPIEEKKPAPFTLGPGSEKEIISKHMGKVTTAMIRPDYYLSKLTKPQ